MSKKRTSATTTQDQAHDDTSTTSGPVASHGERVGRHRAKRAFLAVLSIATSAAASFLAARLARRIRHHAEEV